MSRDYRPEDDPHTPTNIPDDFEERATQTFTWTTKRSGSGTSEYVKPQTEEGYPDYTLMLDLMGIEPGVVFEQFGSRHIVTDRYDVTTKWGETYDVPNGGFKVITKRDSGFIDSVHYTPGENGGPSPLTLWQHYIYGDVDVLGNVFEGDL